MASIRRCHRRDRGSIPRQEALFVKKFTFVCPQEVQEALFVHTPAAASNPGGPWRRAVSGRRALRPAPRVVFVIGLVSCDEYQIL